MKKYLALLLAFAMIFSMVGCGSKGSDKGSDVVVKIGGKDFTEQLILAQLTVQLLESNGIKAEDKSNVAGSDTCRKALEAGEFGLYWEYTGTAWSMLLQESGEMSTDPKELFDAVKAADEANDMVWLNYAPMNNTYALVMPEALSSELGITSYTELGEYITANPGALVLACDHEFTAREDGLPGLVATYGTDFGDSLKTMEMGIVYQTLGAGQADVGMVFATDGRIKANNLILLKDDKNFFPVYNGAPCVRKDILEAHPKIEELLGKLAALLTDEVMQDLNYMVDGDNLEPSEVAAKFLKDQGLVS